LEGGCDNAGDGLESQLSGGAGDFLNEPRKTPGAVPAHFAAAAVAIKELPSPVRFPRFARDQQDDAVCSNPAVTIANADNLLAVEPPRICPVIDQNEIVAGPVHLCKIQNHPENITDDTMGVKVQNPQ
jgi:hypothetical protein